MHRSLSSRTGCSGFGLVETVAVLAIVGVFAAMALPSFRDSQLRSRRVDATQSLQRLQLAQEQYRHDRGHYAGSLDLLPGSTNDQSMMGRYRISLRLVGDDGYELLIRHQ